MICYYSNFAIFLLFMICHAQSTKPLGTEISEVPNVKNSHSITDIKTSILDSNISKNELNKPRLLSDSTLNKISETLGVLNHVGHFLVDMTRGGTPDSSSTSVLPASITPPSNIDTQRFPSTTPSSLLNITHINLKTHNNLFNGKVENKTKDKISKFDDLTNNETEKKFNFTPVIPNTLSRKDNFLSVDEEVVNRDNENICKTPDGKRGRCEDLSSCPVLLLNLNGLRESLCFKSLFVPGVCCPLNQNLITENSEKPISSTPKTSLVLIPQIKTTTEKYSPLEVTTSTDNLLNSIEIDECGQQENSIGRIVGGIASQNGQWPWMAAIFLHGPKRTEFWCGGSLIGDKYILTAAHCTRDSRQRPFAARQFTVRLGDIDLSRDDEPSDPVTFGVKEVRAHAKFSRIGFYNDIAILVLDKVVRKSKYVIPLCLPKQNDHDYKSKLIGKRATVVGWGTTYYGGKESTNQRQADLPIWRNDDCDKAYFQPINENFLCAGYSDGGVDACQGDSGGPLMMRIESRWIQIGIVSFGNKCGEPGYPGVYTRVSQYLEWIKDNTN